MVKYDYNLKLDSVMTIPNTWILLFKFKGQQNWKYLDCEELMNFQAAKEMGLDINTFHSVKKHDTKLSWFNEELDVCIDRLIEDGIDLIEK